ncbi:Cell division protein DamX, binds to the septal ring, contains C-terminal SPOR domain [Mucilaginibacter sp. OK268]|uniref:outer membrane beta-barrel protein n=1 Tax=Mucilaginibacter sp. OK268 TaxID=1881048 RepID=UPI00089226BD|nr:outer membrane beta-barrel protein [Mucilaginibacter sp. OK268]SDP60265.1 Cell division protein DamX, binds to the septal ring, contains C-terminal SPOR domain [Mucilaginibacter sp. OK268]
MDEQLDNDLSNRIREVFDNFDDTSFPSADEGWLLLRKNFPETEKKRPVAWLWWASTAAALLLFLSIGLWITGKKEQTNTLALKPAKKHTEQSITADSATILAATPNPVIKNNAPDTGAAPLAGTKKPTIQAAPYKPAAVPAVPGATTAQAPVYAKTNGSPATQVLANTQVAPAIKAKPATDSTKNIIAKANAQQYVAAAKSSNTTVTEPAKKTKPVDSTKAVMAKINTQQPPVTAPAATTGGSIMLPKQPAKAPKNSMDALFASEQAQQPQKNRQESVEDKKVRFGVYAATFFNYAKGSSNQVNAGAGVTSDIKLSKNLKLSTGLMLAQNTLSYNGGPPPSSNLDALAKAPQALVPFDKQSLFAANSSFPVLKNYNANLIGLDIPINIKYEFNPQKTDAYVSAGLSSGTFINEAYTSVYGYSSAGSSTQTTDDVTHKSFNSFYFAKTLNVSFGIGYPVGKGNRLIVEPFLKYPLDGLGSQQIQFGSAGLNLKLNFTTRKK